MVTRLLIIRFSSIGDIVLTTSLLRQLKLQWEGELEIHYLIKEKYAVVLNNNPHIARIHTFKGSVAECYADLNSVGIDYILDLQSNLRSALVKKRLKALSFSVKKRNFAKYLWIKWGIKSSIGHIVERYRETASAFNIQEDGKGLEFYLGQNDHYDIRQDAFVSVVLGATHLGKRADAEHWTEWLKKVPLPLVLLGGESEQSLAQEISKSVACLNLCGQLTIGQSASVIDQSKVVITGDTGLMHIAAAFQKDVISLWGCTRPSLGMSPWLPGQKSVIIEPPNRKNQPCSKLGNHCKYGWAKKCMHQITSTQIWEALTTMVFDHQIEP